MEKNCLCIFCVTSSGLEAAYLQELYVAFMDENNTSLNSLDTFVFRTV